MTHMHDYIAETVDMPSVNLRLVLLRCDCGERAYGSVPLSIERGSDTFEEYLGRRVVAGEAAEVLGR